jgi:formate--tetrahydrofolate ligase
MPNLVQTTEGTPALVHTGPFANIAHGTSSVISQEVGLRVADYVVNEAGFASDLGAEKYVDIVSRTSGFAPAAAVLVTTVQSLRQQGEGEMERGFANFDRHVAILRAFQLPVIVAINRFPNDQLDELRRLLDYCREKDLPAAISEGFAKGGAGAADLASKVVETIEAHPATTVRRAYELDDSLDAKIRKVALQVYGAAGVDFEEPARKKLLQFAEWGYGRLPVCIAKTQYSLSDNPKLMGAPTGWTLRITDASLSAGAGFVVAIAGNMMLMPGLPKTSRALDIDVDESGEITGLR